MSLIEYSVFSFYRISGIFWEPVVLQIYMNVLLFISLIYTNKKIAFLSAIVILTTWSSTGFGILSVQLFFYIIQQTNGMNIWKALVPLALFRLMLIPLQDNLTNKYQGDSAAAGSGYPRALDTFTAINMFKNNPLLEIDSDYAVYEQERSKNTAFIDMPGAYDAREASDSNSTLNYFVFFGIPLGLSILYSLYSQNIFPKKFVFFLIIIIAMLTEPIGFLVFPLMLIFSNYILKIHAGASHD